MPVQTSYSNEHSPAYEGMKASTSELLNSRSYFAEGGNILPGRGVVFGTDPEKQCVLPATDSTDALVAGITMRELNRVVDDSDVSENQDRPVTVVTQGVIWATAVTGCAPGDPVYLVINPAGGDTIGTLRDSADSTNTVLLTGCRWLTAATVGNLAQVSINRS